MKKSSISVLGFNSSYKAHIERSVHVSHIPSTHARKAPARQLQHFNATYRNIVGRNRLRTFIHPDTTCCEMLGVVSNLKMVKIFKQHVQMLHDVVVLWPGPSNNVAPGHAY